MWCGWLKLKIWALFLWYYFASVHRSIRKLICEDGKTAGGNCFISAFAIAMLYVRLGYFSSASAFHWDLHLNVVYLISKNDLVTPSGISWSSIYSSWCWVFLKVSSKDFHTVPAKFMFTFELNLFKCDSPLVCFHNSPFSKDDIKWRVCTVLLSYKEQPTENY